MKIARNTPEKLKLDDRPWILGGCLVVLILVFAGFGLNALLAGRMGGLLGLVGAALWAVALVVFVRRTTISLDRQTGQMTREVSSLRAKSGQNWPLADIRRGKPPLARPALALRRPNFCRLRIGPRAQVAARAGVVSADACY